jgi:enoyl-CoA hydratase/carnithine racemase
MSAKFAAFEGVDASREGAVLCLLIDRQSKRNAIDLPMFDLLARELVAADSDATITAVLLSGAGDGFTAGHDLEAFEHWPQAPQDPVPRFLHALAAFRKPLVIAAHGWAVGIGATAMLHADWVVAAPDTRIRFPFVDMGITPEAASSLLLARAIGTVRAKQLLLGGEVLTGEQAHGFGLVTQVHAGADLRAIALERARLLGQKPAAAYGRIKSWLAEDADVHARIDEEIAAINQAVLTRRTRAS